jgi:hypothetical protein
MARQKIVNLPIAVEFRPLMIHYESLEDCDGVLFKGFELPNQPDRVQDPWVMRDEFFHLREGDNRALLGWLNKWGQWDEWQEPETFFELEPARLWDKRKLFMNALPGKQKLRAWLSDVSNRFEFTELQLQPDYPPYLMSISDCNQAIRTTITIDLLNRGEFRHCARPDCHAPYAVESEHPRKYCSQYCGHLENLRSKRRDARRQKAARQGKAGERQKGT